MLCNAFFFLHSAVASVSFCDLAFSQLLIIMFIPGCGIFQVLSTNGSPQFRHWHSFFFFQAEDGIRDLTVTRVQTCALPISGCFFQAEEGIRDGTVTGVQTCALPI